MDFLDGSDVDEDNVGDMDQDVENVLLGSDDEEAHSSQQTAKFSGSSFRMANTSNERDHNSEEEDDVLNIVLQGEDEPLDFEGDGSHGRSGGRQQSVPPVKVRSSLMSNSREPSHLESDNNCMPSSSNSNYEEGGANEDFQNRRFVVEEDDFDEVDDETETRNTRSRFTSERKVDSFSGGLTTSSSSSSVGIPIQTVGERKIRPGTPDARPKHWNHNGPRPNGPRHPGRNHHRFQNPPRHPMENPHMRPNMMQQQPIFQFNEGIFTDFNQPMRHPNPRPRQLLPGRLEPRNVDHNPNPMQPQNSGNKNRQHLQPQQNNRSFYPPEGHQNMPPPRMHHPGGVSHPLQPQHSRPDFNVRPQRPRFPPNNMNMNHRNPPPPHGMNHMQGMHPHERLPFPPRQHRPPFRHDVPSHPGMPPGRHPNAAIFPPSPQPQQNMPPNFLPPQQYPPQGNQPPRLAAPQGGPPDNGSNPFFMQPPATATANFNQPRPDPTSFQPEARWGGIHETGPPQMHNGGPWMQNPNQPPQHQNYNVASYGTSAMYEPIPQQPNHMMHSHMVGHPQLPVSIQSSHHLEVQPTPITKSIYIKPNSEIHEALSKGHFLQTKSELRHEHSQSSKYYEDKYHHDRDRDRERERERSSRRGSSPSSERRRNDDDYYDDRKSYHHDRRSSGSSRRKYEESRRHRSRSRSRSRSISPERKYSRSERLNERERDRRRERDIDHDHKDGDKILEEAKKMGLGEDYVKRLEEQRRLREKILKTKEQRRKQVKVAGGGENENAPSSKDAKNASRSSDATNSRSSASSSSNKPKGGTENSKEIEADSTVATSKAGGKSKKILRIVRDKSGKIISKKVHVVLVAKPQQEGQQQSSTT